MTLTFEPESAPPVSPPLDQSSGDPRSDAGDPNADDPYSPGLLTLLDALGAMIGVMAIIVPLATVLVARQPSPESLPDPTSVHGSESPAGIPRARTREPGGGDTRWLTQ